MLDDSDVNGLRRSKELAWQVCVSQGDEIRRLRNILAEAAELLGMLARPSGRPESLSHIWARCVEIDAKARAELGLETK